MVASTKTSSSEKTNTVTIASRAADGTDRAATTDGTDSDSANETLRRAEAAAVASAVAAVRGTCRCSPRVTASARFCRKCSARSRRCRRSFGRRCWTAPAPSPADSTGSRLVGPECAPLLAVIADPPAGSESLAKRAIRVLADADAAEAAYLRDAADAGGVVAGDAAKDRADAPRASMDALVRAAEALAEKTRVARDGVRRRKRRKRHNDAANASGDAFEDVELLLPLLGAMSAEKVRSLVPRLVALPLDLFKQALDRLCGENARRRCRRRDFRRAARSGPGAASGVGLKKIIHDGVRRVLRAPGRVRRGDAGERDVQDGGDAPAPLLFMRTVIQRRRRGRPCASSPSACCAV